MRSRVLATPVKIWPTPCEIADPIPFEQDEVHHSYDPEYAQRFWRVLLQVTRVFTVFRSRFQGKVSPVHLFWGALDLACTRFSGRTAPPHKSMPGLPDRVTRDAYSHEVSSCGFWPGGLGMDAMFYSYAYPEPPGFSDYRIAACDCRDSTRTSANLCFRMKRCARRPIPMELCWISCRARMKPRPIARNGIARRWRLSRIRKNRE